MGELQCNVVTLNSSTMKKTIKKQPNLILPNLVIFLQIPTWMLMNTKDILLTKKYLFAKKKLFWFSPNLFLFSQICFYFLNICFYFLQICFNFFYKFVVIFLQICFDFLQICLINILCFVKLHVVLKSGGELLEMRLLNKL